MEAFHLPYLNRSLDTQRLNATDLYASSGKYTGRLGMYMSVARSHGRKYRGGSEVSVEKT